MLMPSRLPCPSPSRTDANGTVVDSDRLIRWATLNGYLRVPTVRETGEYAVRGGLVDLFPASMETPLRFDFFGKQLETIRTFDPGTQRTTGTLTQIALAPMSEVFADSFYFLALLDRDDPASRGRGGCSHRAQCGRFRSPVL